MRLFKRWCVAGGEEAAVVLKRPSDYEIAFYYNGLFAMNAYGYPTEEAAINKLMALRPGMCEVSH